MKITVELTNQELHEAIRLFVEAKMGIEAKGGVMILDIKEETVSEDNVDFIATVDVDLQPF